MKHVFAILFLLGLFPLTASARQHFWTNHHHEAETLIVWRNPAGQPLYSGEYVRVSINGRQQLRLVRSWCHGPLLYRCMAPHSVDHPGYGQIRGHLRFPLNLPQPWKVHVSKGNGRERYVSKAWNHHYPARLNYLWYLKHRSYLSMPSMCFVPEGYKVCLQEASVPQGKFTPVFGGHLNTPINVLPYLYFDNIIGLSRKTVVPQISEHVYYRQAPLEKASLLELGVRFAHLRR